MFAIVLCTLAALGAAAPQQQSAYTLQKMQDFAKAVYNHIALDVDKDNIFFSPASLTIALGMLYQGARGETAATMKEVLKWPSDEELEAIMKRKNLALQSNPEQNLTLESASRVFVENTVTLRPEYLSALSEIYGADAQTADFRNNAEAERTKINAWVEEKTNGLIKDLLPQGVPDAATQAILTNALYFKALWLNPFTPARTHKGVFHAYDGTDKEVSFMKVEADFQVADMPELNAQLIRLPYQADDTFFNVILPSANASFANAEQNMTPEHYWNAVQNLRTIRNLDLSMPKFELTQELALKSILSKMGLEGLFFDADLTGMIDGDQRLKVTDILHKARLKVDETGTEAAAATAILVGYTSFRTPIEIIVDRPFMFSIQRGQDILFIGRLTRPPDTRFPLL